MVRLQAHNTNKSRGSATEKKKSLLDRLVRLQAQTKRQDSPEVGTVGQQLNSFAKKCAKSPANICKANLECYLAKFHTNNVTVMCWS